MEKRAFLFDNFHSWYDWRLTLTAKDTTEPEPKTNYVALDGMSGTLDLTEALTGEVAYNDRTVLASFWSSEGTYQERDAVLRQITASLHGKKVKIVEPDDPDHFFYGRVMVRNLVRTQVYISFDLEAICEPWRYAIHETKRRVVVDGAADVVIRNNGIKTLCPTITVDGRVYLRCDNVTTEMADDVYLSSGIKLRPGSNVIGVDGNGSVTFTYREAGL